MRKRRVKKGDPGRFSDFFFRLVVCSKAAEQGVKIPALSGAKASRPNQLGKALSGKV